MAGAFLRGLTMAADGIWFLFTEENKGALSDGAARRACVSSPFPRATFVMVLVTFPS